MKKSLSMILRIVSGVGSVLITGCTSSPEPRYFILEAPAVSDQPVPGNNRQLLMVGPITVAEHLQRRGIASREEQGRVKIHQFDRWAGALDQNIANVVTEILQQKYGPDNAFNYYSNFSADHNYAVKIHISKFDRIAGDKVALAASWQIRNGTKATKTVRSASFSQPVFGPETGDTVSAMNAALAKLADAVDQSIPN